MNCCGEAAGERRSFVKVKIASDPSGAPTDRSDCISCPYPNSDPNGCPRLAAGSVSEKAEMTQSAPTKALIGWMQQETVQVAHHG